MILDQKNSCPDYGRRFKRREGKSAPPLVNKGLSDPFRANCNESKCLACKGSKSYTNCRKMNIGYTIECEECRKEGKTRAYEGESCRNLYLRGLEHKRLLETKSKSSVLYKHAIENHTNEDPNKVEFSMKVTGSFRNSLSRIIDEGIRIKERKPEELLNSKCEYYGPSVKRRVLV